MGARWIVFGIVAAVMAPALLAAAAWAAEDAATLNQHITAINRTARTPEGRQVVAQRLSRDLGISTQTLQTQREQTGLGWGEILIANRISQQTGLTFNRVVSEFRGGKCWGEIARRHDLNLGQLVRDVRASRAAVQTSAPGTGSTRVRSGRREEGITSALNRTEAGAGARSAGRSSDHGGREDEDLGSSARVGASGQGMARGGDLGVSFGTGPSGHGSGGLGLGHGGGRR